MARSFSCQRPSTLAVVYVIPSSPDRRYPKNPIQDLLILLIVLQITQNVCQRQPQCVGPVLPVQDAPFDCQGTPETWFGPNMRSVVLRTDIQIEKIKKMFSHCQFHLIGGRQREWNQDGHCQHG